MRGGIITDFRNKLAAIFGLLVLAICIFSPTVSAKDYSLMESMVEASLIGDFNLSLMDANVSINTEQVTINCTTQFSMNETGAPPKEFGLLLTNVLGTYRSVVNAAPEVGDLLIVMKSWNRPTTLTMTCPKSWIQGIVSGDNNAAYELILKVFQTKKFRNDTHSTYMPATFSWGTPVPNITTTISPSATPVTTILDHSMASNVDESSNHVITRTNEFSSTDNKAYSWLSLGNVGAGTVWWYWYYNNNPYKTSSVDIPPNPNGGNWPSYNIWYYIDIAGDNPADMPGIWYVDVYLGDQKLLREKFALIQLNPDNANAWNNNGVALNELGKHDEAIQDYDKAIELDPQHASAWLNKGNALDDQKKYDEAIKAYDRAIEINPQYADAWDEKGNALDRQGKYDEAIQAYDRAIEIDPQDALTWYNKGIALGDQGKYDEAIQAYDRAIEINPQYADAWNNKGAALEAQGKYDESILASDKAIGLDPQHASAWNNKGVALIHQGKYDEAIQAYDKAIEINPQYADAWNNKGNALNKLGRTTESNAAFTKAKELGYSG